MGHFTVCLIILNENISITVICVVSSCELKAAFTKNTQVDARGGGGRSAMFQGLKNELLCLLSLLHMME